MPGSTVFTTGDTLTWTPANGVTGSAINAFTVSAFDGQLTSSPPVQVSINVRPFGTAFDLTGAWQVGGRSETDSLGMLQLDLEYIDNWSLRRDVVILFRTVGAVLVGRGAY